MCSPDFKCFSEILSEISLSKNICKKHFEFSVLEPCYVFHLRIIIRINRKALYVAIYSCIIHSYVMHDELDISGYCKHCEMHHYHLSLTLHQ